MSEVTAVNLHLYIHKDDFPTTIEEGNAKTIDQLLGNSHISSLIKGDTLGAAKLSFFDKVIDYLSSWFSGTQSKQEAIEMISNILKLTDLNQSDYFNFEKMVMEASSNFEKIQANLHPDVKHLFEYEVKEDSATFWIDGVELLHLTEEEVMRAAGVRVNREGEEGEADTNYIPTGHYVVDGKSVKPSNDQSVLLSSEVNFIEGYLR